MKLAPGLYKISSRSRIPTHSYLRVFKSNNQLYFEINGGVASMAGKYNEMGLDGYIVVKKMERVNIDKITITLNWYDNDGDEFNYSTRDVTLIKNLFERYPEIARAMGSKKY